MQNNIRTEEEQKKYEEGFRNAIRESMKDGSLFRALNGLPVKDGDVCQVRKD